MVSRWPRQPGTTSRRLVPPLQEPVPPRGSGSWWDSLHSAHPTDLLAERNPPYESGNHALRASGRATNALLCPAISAEELVIRHAAPAAGRGPSPSLGQPQRLEMGLQVGQ